MDFSLATLPNGVVVPAWLLAAGALWAAVRGGAWQSLAAGPVLGRWLGGCVVVMLLWRMSAPLQAGHGLHLLGVTAAVLVFGLARALALLALASAGALLAKGLDPRVWAFEFVLLAVVPALFAAGADRLIQRRLPNHIFIFIFVNACLVSTLSVLMVGLGATVTLAAGGQPVDGLLENFLPVFILLAFAEAWLTGMAITLLVVFRPGWVASFDDSRYLLRK